MRTQSWVGGRLGQLLTIAAGLLVLTAGFCLFGHDQDGADGHGMSPDLCAGMLVSSLGLVLLAGPLVNGRLLPDPIRSVYATCLHIPDPPPKSRSLA